jgi:hypothetical protein
MLRSPLTPRPNSTALTSGAWKEQNQRKSCFIWANERKTGRRLLEAVTIDGLNEKLVLREGYA